eukprot:TRINITY_DN36716_c0_g1_i2.p1 TRINITY_DN36716_c0_g1~~TRINITY_DN36716_c0_g1_i2.p1  ORF type:complete len:153 (-),score=14.50 TRINITY_DN36716_c0_g1_i2:159-617(-)
MCIRDRRRVHGEHLTGSNLKKKHMRNVRTTFRSSTEEDEDNPFESCKLSRSFLEINANLRRQIVESESYRTLSTEKPIPIKGIFNIHVPTEGELQNRARNWRKAMNPLAFSEELHREKKDLLLSKKRREQRVLQSALKFRNQRQSGVQTSPG